tara:strand:- start:329 stop:523 length:195 start_codon:yes stop_codon:yes gene_type:complete
VKYIKYIVFRFKAIRSTYSRFYGWPQSILLTDKDSNDFLTSRSSDNPITAEDHVGKHNSADLIT